MQQPSGSCDAIGDKRSEGKLGARRRREKCDAAPARVAIAMPPDLPKIARGLREVCREHCFNASDDVTWRWYGELGLFENPESGLAFWSLEICVFHALGCSGPYVHDVAIDERLERKGGGAIIGLWLH